MRSLFFATGQIGMNFEKKKTSIGSSTQGENDVISSYQLFSAILYGKLCEMFVILTSVDVTFSIR